MEVVRRLIIFSKTNESNSPSSDLFVNPDNTALYKGVVVYRHVPKVSLHIAPYYIPYSVQYSILKADYDK